MHFYDLDLLDVGDKIHLDIDGYKFTYLVKWQKVVGKYDWSVIDEKPITQHLVYRLANHDIWGLMLKIGYSSGHRLLRLQGHLLRIKILKNRAPGICKMCSRHATVPPDPKKPGKCF